MLAQRKARYTYSRLRNNSDVSKWGVTEERVKINGSCACTALGFMLWATAIATWPGPRRTLKVVARLLDPGWWGGSHDANSIFLDTNSEWHVPRVIRSRAVSGCHTLSKLGLVSGEHCLEFSYCVLGTMQSMCCGEEARWRWDHILTTLATEDSFILTEAWEWSSMYTPHLLNSGDAH